jgi:hypothetical protein
VNDDIAVPEPARLGRRWAWRRVDPGLLMQRRPRHGVAPSIEERLREPVGEQGWALVDVATGEPVLLVDDGYGSPTVAVARSRCWPATRSSWYMLSPAWPRSCRERAFGRQAHR